MKKLLTVITLIVAIFAMGATMDAKTTKRKAAGGAFNVSTLVQKSAYNFYKKATMAQKLRTAGFTVSVNNSRKLMASKGGTTVRFYPGEEGDDDRILIQFKDQAAATAFENSLKSSGWEASNGAYYLMPPDPTGYGVYAQFSGTRAWLCAFWEGAPIISLNQIFEEYRNQ